MLVPTRWGDAARSCDQSSTAAHSVSFGMHWYAWARRAGPVGAWVCFPGPPRPTRCGWIKWIDPSKGGGRASTQTAGSRLVRQTPKRYSGSSLRRSLGKIPSRPPGEAGSSPKGRGREGYVPLPMHAPSTSLPGRFLQLAQRRTAGYALGTSRPTYPQPTDTFPQPPHLTTGLAAFVCCCCCGCQGSRKSWAPSRNRHLNMHADASCGSPSPMSPQGNRYWTRAARPLARPPVGALMHCSSVQTGYPCWHNPGVAERRGRGGRESVPGCLPACVCLPNPCHP